MAIGESITIHCLCCRHLFNTNVGEWALCEDCRKNICENCRGLFRTDHCGG